MTLDAATTATEGLTYCDEGWQKGCGTCGNCGAVLTGRSGWFCRGQRGRNSCRKQWRRNHQWTLAKAAALRRDGYHCVRLGCGIGPVPRAGAVKGRVEVNHRTSVAATARAAGLTTATALRSKTGCWNHLDGLETLCIAHHHEETARQRAAGELG